MTARTLRIAKEEAEEVDLINHRYIKLLWLHEMYSFSFQPKMHRMKDKIFYSTEIGKMNITGFITHNQL